MYTPKHTHMIPFKVVLRCPTAKRKRIRAIVFSKKGSGENGKTVTTTINFGSMGGQTFIDHKDQDKKRNYIARHIVNEDWDTINAGSLSRYLLWNKPTLLASIRDFEKRFHVTVYNEMFSTMDRDSLAYKRARKEADATYKTHSAYKSMFISKRYNELAGHNKSACPPTNSKTNGNTSNGLSRWIKEKWMNQKYLIGKLEPCGSARHLGGSNHYNLCRPTIRVSKDTPITWSELIEKYGIKRLRMFVSSAENAKIDGLDVRVNWEKLEIKIVP